MPPPSSRKRRRILSPALQSPTSLVAIDAQSPSRNLEDHHEPGRRNESFLNGNGLERPYLDNQVDLIDISSSQSDQSYHTATGLQELNFIPNGGTRQPSPVFQLQQAVRERTGRVKEETSRSNHRPLAEIPNFTTKAFPPPIHLSQGLADHLVSVYLQREYVNLPILDLLDFQSAYGTARSENDTGTGSSAFHGALNIIFSLSGLSTSSMADEEVIALFSHGQHLSKVGSGGTLRENVQSYLLQSQYLCNTGNPKSAWVLVGLTIRTAQVLGLHSKTPGQDTRGRRDRELTRRLWHSAMILERMIALQLGHPPQTSDPQKVPLPTHLDTDYIDYLSGERPDPSLERPSLIEFLTACARLYSQVEDILAWEDEVRIQPKTCAAKKLASFDFTIFLKVDSFLFDWQTSLPKFLCDGTASELWKDPIVSRQRNILRARYLYLRLRLYRPFMILGLMLTIQCNCRPGGRFHATIEDFASLSSPAVLGMVRDASVRSVVVALELVNLIQAHEDELDESGNGDCPRNLISPYWENIDYLYACGTVLLATRLCPYIEAHGDVTGSIKEGAVETRLSQVIGLLDRYHGMRLPSRLANVARACCTTLRNLSDTIRSSGMAGGATMALDRASRNRVLERTELGGPAISSNQRQTMDNAIGYYGWIESLPLDLTGALD
ncbi:fungal-specific transcription factor domain-containing protein [Aspergillus avenaceus]|uniref:Fungal-specific transcription factor domain-containing protein n=1 Tax=Aspergillus avenaceus TaxID=36643 RepID=A0A5N6TI49_ASPAV|nr:fungal-specific transcription factor domain-containing protein [Aspergillus avenaceus]